MAGTDARDLYGYSGAYVKVLPSNQSLILVGEPGGRRAAADPLLEQASRLVTGSADLKRVTILSSRPDSTVVVQADYFPAKDGYSDHEILSNDEIPSAPPQLPATQSASSNALTLAVSGLRVTGEPATSSYYLKPTQLYAQTQRGFENTNTSVLDVLA
jgi:hypothetical protein